MLFILCTARLSSASLGLYEAFFSPLSARTKWSPNANFTSIIGHPSSSINKISALSYLHISSFFCYQRITGVFTFIEDWIGRTPAWRLREIWNALHRWWLQLSNLAVGISPTLTNNTTNTISCHLFSTPSIRLMYGSDISKKLFWFEKRLRRQKNLYNTPQFDSNIKYFWQVNISNNL